MSGALGYRLQQSKSHAFVTAEKHSKNEPGAAATAAPTEAASL